MSAGIGTLLPTLNSRENNNFLADAFQVFRPQSYLSVMCFHQYATTIAFAIGACYFIGTTTLRCRFDNLPQHHVLVETYFALYTALPTPLALPSVMLATCLESCVCIRGILRARFGVLSFAWKMRGTAAALPGRRRKQR